MVDILNARHPTARLPDAASTDVLRAAVPCGLRLVIVHLEELYRITPRHTPLAEQRAGLRDAVRADIARLAGAD